MGERLSTTRCPKAYARPHPRQRVPRLALPAPHNGRTWPTVPHLLASCTQRRSGQVCTETFLLRFLESMQAYFSVVKGSGDC
jgi:hypothetical protein